MADKYVSNNLSLEFADEKASADIFSRQQDYSLRHKHEIKGLSNDLQYVPALKNGDVIQINWTLKYGSKPQSLEVSPGMFPNILNEGSAYQATVQELEVPTLLTQISSGYRFTKGKVKQYYHLGLNLNKQKLNSEIFLVEGGSLIAPAIDSTVNNLDWTRSQYSATADYSWKHKRLDASLIIPISFQRTSYKDASYALDAAHNNWLVSPALRLKYRVAQEDDLNFSYAFGNSNGNIQDVYRGLVIRNYRSLSANSAELDEQSTHSLSTNYHLARTVRLFFANFGLSYSSTRRDAMLSQEISNEVSQTFLLPLQNTVNTLSASAGIDKYIFPLASIVKLGASWSLTDFNQLFNKELLPFTNSNWGLQPSIDIKLFGRTNLAYQGTFNWSQSKQKDNRSMGYSMFSATQRLSLPTSLFKRVYGNLSARHLFSQQPQQQNISYVFLDGYFRYRAPKTKTDFILSVDNIANVKTYRTYSLSANQQSQNAYSLRGRTAMLKVIFSL